MEDLGGLEIELGDAVEYPLAGPEENGDDVEPELVDDARLQRLADRRGAARDVDAVAAGSVTGLGVGGVEAIRDEVKRRPALHLDRRVSVMGEDEHGRVVGRLGSPPARPLLVPLAADRAE